MIMEKEDKGLNAKMKAKDLEVGQELYDFYIGDDGHSKMSKVYVIKKNKTNFYFSHDKNDRTNSYMRLKTTGTLPKLWRPSFIDIHYISDDKNFGTLWEKQIEQRKFYKERIDHVKNAVFYRDSVGELKELYETIERFEKTKHANQKNVFF